MTRLPSGEEVAMIITWKRVVVGLTLALGICILSAGVSYATDKGSIVGWEKGSAYNKLYDLNEWDSFKGYVKGFRIITPLPGMSPGVALLVRDRDSDKVITVHLGPRSFVHPNNVGVRKGEKVHVRGVWAEIKGKEVFIASKVKKGDYFEYKVRRTKDGTPYWTMSPAERAKERTHKGF
jgi:hypothetical protein